MAGSRSLVLLVKLMTAVTSGQAQGASRSCLATIQDALPACAGRRTPANRLFFFARPPAALRDITHHLLSRLQQKTRHCHCVSAAYLR